MSTPPASVGSPRRRRRRHTVVLLLAFAFLTAACGDNDDAELTAENTGGNTEEEHTTTTTSTTTSTSTTTTTTTTVPTTTTAPATTSTTTAPSGPLVLTYDDANGTTFTSGEPRGWHLTLTNTTDRPITVTVWDGCAPFDVILHDGSTEVYAWRAHVVCAAATGERTYEANQATSFDLDPVSFDVPPGDYTLTAEHLADPHADRITVDVTVVG